MIDLTESKNNGIRAFLPHIFGGCPVERINPDKNLSVWQIRALNEHLQIEIVGDDQLSAYEHSLKLTDVTVEAAVERADRLLA